MAADEDGLHRHGQERARALEERRFGRIRAARRAGQERRLRHREDRAGGKQAMIARLIRWSIANRFLVLLATLMVTGWGIWAAARTPLDAIPDLSDVQVIIRTTYP